MTRNISIELPDRDLQDTEHDGNTVRFDIRSLFSLAIRRLWLIGTITIAIFSFFVYATMTETPQYSATATVIVDTAEMNVIDLGSVMSGSGFDTSVMDTEVEVIRSAKLLERVVEAQDLVSDPEFNANLRNDKPGLLSQAKSFVTGLIKPSDNEPSSQPPLSAEERQQRLVEGAAGTLRSKTSVSRIGRTYLINISVTSVSPQTAALLANAIADQYRVEQLEAKLDATRTATDWLARRVQVLRQEVAEKEAAVEAFRTESGLLTAQGTTLTESSIQALQAQRIALQSDLDRVNARYQSMRRQLQSGAGVDSITEVLDSPVISNLKSQRAEILRRVAELEATLLPRHPDLISAKSEAEDIESQIEAEVRRITASLEAEVKVAQDRIADIDRRLRSDRAELIRNNSSLVRLRELEREAEASQEIYEEFAARLKQTREQNDLVQSDARVLTAATVPNSPSSPRILLNLVLGLVLGGILGGAAAILAEIFDGKVATSDDIEKRLGIPAIGSVPLIRSLPILSRQDGDPGQFLVNNPLSAFAESIRYLRAAITFSDLDSNTQVVTLTSSIPDEGKTSLSQALARMSAMSGTRTLVIDGDFRRRQLTEAFGISPDYGLIEYLAGSCGLEQAIQTDPATNLEVLPLNLKGHAPHDVFGTRAFDRLLDELKQRYELIVIDTGPILLMAEARVIAGKSDKTILVVRWRHGTRQLIRKSIGILRAFKADILGATLNMVDTSNRRYSGGEAVSYGAYQKYYTQEQPSLWSRLFGGKQATAPKLPTLTSQPEQKETVLSDQEDEESNPEDGEQSSAEVRQFPSSS